MIDISISDEDFSRALRQLKGIPYGIQKAMYPAVAETMQHIRKGLVGYLVSEVPLPDGALKSAVKLSQPVHTGGTVSGYVAVRSNAQPLIYYDVEPQTLTAQPGKRPSQWADFTYSLRSGERRAGKERGGSSFPFIAVMPGGHMGVYFRASFTSRNTGKVSIKQAYGPTMQYHVVTPRVREMFERESEERLPVILARQVQQTLAVEAKK